MTSVILDASIRPRRQGKQVPIRPDLIIIGGGIIGCSIAHRMRHEYAEILIVEAAATLGTGASSAAIGGITPQSGEFCLGPLGALADRSREMYPAWLRDICRESGQDVPVLATGQLQVALSPEEMADLTEMTAPLLRARGVPITVLDRSELLAREPLLTGRALGGILMPTELAIEPPLLMDALRTILLADERIRVLPGTLAEGVSASPDGVRVSLRDGRTLTANAAVISAGHLSDSLVGLPEDVLFPVKGQAVQFSPAGRGADQPRHQCYARLMDDTGVPHAYDRVAYLVPRPDGRVAAGVTFEPGRADTRPTSWARDAIVDGVTRLVPRAARWPITDHCAGIRPGSADGAPLIGHIDPYQRVVVAAGHYGLGITLAPLTAHLVELLLTESAIDPESARDLGLCAPERFMAGRRGGAARPLSTAPGSVPSASLPCPGPAPDAC